MAGAGKKWAIGCGIGCGLMVVILGGVGTCGYFAVRDIKERADGLDEGFEQLRADFGEPGDFTPAADGTIAPDRMETFLAARDAMASTRDEIGGTLATLDGDGSVIAKFQAGARLVPSLLAFIAERNRGLLEQGMGVGEYQYIYSVAFYAMLGEDPGDGPSFVLGDSDDEERDGGRVRVTWNTGDDEAVRERRARRVRSYVNELQGQVLANQLAAWENSGAPADDPWGLALAAEVAAMRDETLRLPWEEGLPPQLRDSLEPYRDRLAASYDPMTSIIELGLVHEE